MSALSLQRARQAVELLGAVCFAALGLHLMILAIGDTQARRAPHRALPLAAPEPQPAAPSAVSTARSVLPVARAAHPAADAAPLRLMLSVTVGAPRSEVYVNGSRVGYSPYLGDYSCKSGEQLHIEVVAEKGPLITRSATCEGSTLLIR